MILNGWFSKALDFSHHKSTIIFGILAATPMLNSYLVLFDTWWLEWCLSDVFIPHNRAPPLPMGRFGILYGMVLALDVSLGHAHSYFNGSVSFLSIRGLGNCCAVLFSYLRGSFSAHFAPPVLGLSLPLMSCHLWVLHFVTEKSILPILYFLVLTHTSSYVPSLMKRP